MNRWKKKKKQSLTEIVITVEINPKITIFDSTNNLYRAGMTLSQWSFHNSSFGKHIESRNIDTIPQNPKKFYIDQVKHSEDGVMACICNLGMEGFRPDKSITRLQLNWAKHTTTEIRCSTSLKKHHKGRMGQLSDVSHWLEAVISGKVSKYIWHMWAWC